MIYQGDNLSVRALENGIVELTLDSQGSVNKLDLSTLESLDQALDALAGRDDVKGLMLTSAKSAFIVGADITEFLGLFAKPDQELSDWVSRANAIFNRLEDLPYPTISAVNGHALGGGCECILATDLRVASSDARIGLPETKLGIMPGFGGTVRLPRLVGADTAMEIITAGKEKRAAAALKEGLVDAVVEVDNLRDAAISMLTQAISEKIDWQRRRQQKKTTTRPKPHRSRYELYHGQRYGCTGSWKALSRPDDSSYRD